jgi:hypothetical protein
MLLGSVSSGNGSLLESAKALLSAGLSLLMPNTCAPALVKASYSSRNLQAWIQNKYQVHSITQPQKKEVPPSATAYAQLW